MKGWRMGILTTLLSLLGANEAPASPPSAQPQSAPIGQTEIKAANKPDIIEVMGVGLSIEMFRQAKVLAEIQKTPRGNILPTDPKKYPWGAMHKMDVARKRSGDALEYAASWFVEKWPIPALPVYPQWRRTDKQPDGIDFYIDRIDRLRQEAGMHWHRIYKLPPKFSDAPDGVIDAVFDFFKRFPEAPAILVMGFDGEVMRTYTGRPDGSPSRADDSYRKPDDMTGSYAALLFAKRDRIEPLRKATRSDITFTPSEYLPQPWTPEQIAQFDKLPTLGYLIRPTYVSYLKDGKPLDDHEKQLAFLASWKEALAMLPEGKKPARIFYDFGFADKGRKVVPLTRTLAETDPGFDLFDANHGINLTDRLGDIGATSPFVGLALSLIASYQSNDVSASVNLRRDDGASIVLVLPTDDRRPHPAGPNPIDFKLVPYLK